MKTKKSFSFMFCLALFFTLIFFFVNSDSIKASNKSTWIKGNPSIILGKTRWETGYIKDYDGYSRVISSPFSKTEGFTPIVISYNSHKKAIGSGCPSSAREGMNPYYKKVGRNLYKLVSSCSSSKKHSALYYELHSKNIKNSMNYGSAEFLLLKIHDKNHISIWFYDNLGSFTGKKTYSGYFHRV